MGDRGPQPPELTGQQRASDKKHRPHGGSGGEAPGLYIFEITDSVIFCRFSA